MNTKKLIYPLFFLAACPVFADASEGSLSETLFEHILNGRILEIFPFLRPITLPFGMTVHLLMLFLSASVILVSFIIAFRQPSLKPRGFEIILESLILFVRDDIVYPVMGKKKGDKWLPFFATLFIFLLVVNYLGLIPAFKTATGNITVTTALALMILLLIFIVGMKTIGFKQFFKNLYPEGTPLPIGLFVALLEFIWIFIRSVVLSLRIFANMFAGHLAILSFLVLMFVLNPLFGFVSLPFAVFTYALEVLVALIQALVFTLLSCIFISMASSAHEA